MRRKRRDRRNPFDMFSNFDEIFEHLLEGMTSTDEQEPFIYGFSMTHRLGEEPVIREFGNIRPHCGGFDIGERKPIIDVFESEDEIQVVAEIPGVEKENIKLDATETSLGINAKTEDREYSEHVNLPAKVDPNSAKASYRNGVLEVILKRVEPVELKERRKSINVE